MVVDTHLVSEACNSVLDSVGKALDIPVNFVLNKQVPPDYMLFNEQSVSHLGAQMILHHAFTTSAFTKFAFEYGLEKSLNLTGLEAILASQGNPGHDISVNGQRFSLKTEAARNAKPAYVHISKWMELGKNTNWGDDPDVINELVNEFLTHMGQYERILVLRFVSATKVSSSFQRYYELIEIPKELLASCISGECEMKSASRQFPKPGYCRVKDVNGDPTFSLYFDGGGERKLQIKALNKKLCIKHATWEF